MRTLKWVAILLVAAGAGGLAWRALHVAPTPAFEQEQSEEAAPRPADSPAPPMLTGKAPPSPPEQIAPDPAPAGPGLRLYGRVLMAGRHPATGFVASFRDEEGTVVRATFHRADGGFCLTVPITGRVTDAGGWLEFDGGEDLIACRAVGEWTVRRARASPTGLDHDIGAVVLGASYDLPVVVAVPARPGADVDVALFALPSHTNLPSRQTRAAAGSVFRFSGLPAGEYRVVAMAVGCGRGAAGVVLPRSDNEPVSVSLAPERILEVSVLEQGTRKPIQGAHIDVWERTRRGRGYTTGPILPPLAVEPTGIDGRTRIRGLHADSRLVLRVHADGYERPTSERDCDSVVPVPAGATLALATLRRVRPIRWPIEEGDVAIPADGTVLRIRTGSNENPHALPETGRVEDGMVVVDDWPPTSCFALAFAPDGSVARLMSPWERGSDIGPKTRFKRLCELEVLLRLPDGSPAVGFSVDAVATGRGPRVENALTDEGGRAVLSGLYPGWVRVAVSPSADAKTGILLGKVQVGNGQARLEGVVHAPRKVVLRLRLAGRIGLPTHYDLRISRSPVSVGTEDSKRGEIHFMWFPPADGEREAVLASEGYETVHIPLRVDGDDPQVMDLDLEPSCGLVVRVQSPADGRCRLVLQSWGASEGHWRAATAVSPDGRFGLDADGVARLVGLPPGRYRVIDALSLAATSPVDHRDDTPSELKLDLSKAGYVTGHVEGPSERYLRELGVLVWPGEGDVPTGEQATRRRTVDGTFRIRVPGDRPVTLEAWHPLELPAPEGGRVTVIRPRDDVVLRLVGRPVAVVHFDEQIEPYRWLPWSRFVRVFLFHGEIGGTPAYELEGLVGTKAVRFAGYTAGTYTVWIDAEPYVPVVIQHAKLGAGTTDLGEISTSTGSTVVLGLTLPEGQREVELDLEAVHKGSPTYRRIFEHEGPPPVRLEGLGSGSFRLFVKSLTPVRELERRIDSDGISEVPLHVDLR